MRLIFDFESKTPIYQQLRDQIVVGIAEGKLSPGEKLPTIRALADESGINMMTVSKAYQMLNNEGYIVTDRRKGTLISNKTKESPVKEETLKELRVIISELQLSELSLDEVLTLCKEYYRRDCNVL